MEDSARRGKTLALTPRGAASRAAQFIVNCLLPLALRNIRKRFGAIAALRRGSLEVDAGQVHLLLGENGSSKSTLVKIVAGMVGRDAGEMLW